MLPQNLKDPNKSKHLGKRNAADQRPTSVKTRTEFERYL